MPESPSESDIHAAAQRVWQTINHADPRKVVDLTEDDLYNFVAWLDLMRCDLTAKIDTVSKAARNANLAGVEADMKVWAERLSRLENEIERLRGVLEGG